MHRQRLKSGTRALTVYSCCAGIIVTALSLVALARAADQPIDLDGNTANGAESKVATKVLQTFPVKIENTVQNNAAGMSYVFKWPGAGPGGFASAVTAGPGVGTAWTWTTSYQVYTILSPVTFTPARSVSVFGSQNPGIQPGTGVTSYMAPGRSILPSSVTLSDASLTSSLITFFSPKKTVATCGFQCAPGECETFLENRSGGTVTLSTHQLGCCPEPRQLICDSGCTSYLTDVNNCGGCGNVCAADELCSDGECVCPSGLNQCGAGCIDLTSDSANCGGCGNACAPDESCSGGVCACDAGLTNCGAGCTDLGTDPGNCGACGNVCPVGGSCAGGVCACPAGTADCGGVCVNLQSDPLNCGACGRSCGVDAVCGSGACTTCRSPRGTACGNVCVNTHTDPNNCGGCGEVCDFSGCPSSGQGTCSQGSSCVCSPSAGTTTSSLLRSKPVRLGAPRTRTERALARRNTSVRTVAGTSVLDRGIQAPAVVTNHLSSLDVDEAPVCDVQPVVQTLPAGGVYTQTQTGGRFSKEILTTVAISVDGQTIAQGPCPQVVPVTGVDTSGVIFSASAVATKDASGDGLCQPGEAWCEYLVTLVDLGDSPCLDPSATMSSPPDQYNPNSMTFLNATSPYPSFPGYPGDGLPIDKKTNAVAFSIAPPAIQPADVGRPFLLSVSCSNRPAPVETPIILGIGSACAPGDIDGETYDRLDGFQSPVRAALVAEGNPVNYSTGKFNHGSTVPFKLTLSCGSLVLTDGQVEPNPEVTSLVHETLGPQSLIGINGGNNANPDDPRFSCTDVGCDYQFRTDPLPTGKYIISVRLPDSRIFQAGFTISP